MDTFDPVQKRISVHKWQKLLGELKSMTLSIPGMRGLFSILQEILAHKCGTESRLRLSPDVHDTLGDFRWLAKDLQRRPTRIAEIIPASEPATLGAQDAAETGMGGVHFIPLPDGFIQPLLWRSPFSSHVQSQLVSFSNPMGKITNSELELAASVAQHDILAQSVDIQESTIHNATNNMTTVWWQRKGGTSTTGPATGSSGFKRFTNATTVMFLSSTTYRDQPMPCSMTAADVGTCPTHSCLLTSLVSSHIIVPSDYANYASQCTPP
jgi:hypothetical protein